MASRISVWMKGHPLVAYFVLAYALTWLVQLPLILSAQGLLHMRIPPGLHFLASIGPILAAFIVTGITGGAAGIRKLLGRMSRWRVGIGWVLIALFSPAALFLIAVVILWISSGVWPGFSQFGHVAGLPQLGWLAGWVFHTLTFGFGEETGWRGFALPRLQRGRSALSATLILTVFWALWHLPLFFYKENYMDMGIGGAVGFFLGMLAGAIVLTWLYNSTNGSILMVALWHGAFNTAIAGAEGGIAAIVSTFIMVGAVIIVLVAKPANLSRSRKFVVPARGESRVRHPTTA